MKRFVPSPLVLATVTILAMYPFKVWSQDQVKGNVAVKAAQSEPAAKVKEQAKQNVEDKKNRTAGSKDSSEDLLWADISKILGRTLPPSESETIFASIGKKLLEFRTTEFIDEALARKRPK